MNKRVMKWAGLVIGVSLVGLYVARLAAGPRHSMALLRVVDAAGKPIAGAVIQADGLRPKPVGSSGQGHYGWGSGKGWPANDPVVSDHDGWVRVPYPKYIVERIETGQISFSVDHPDYVPDRPFRTVSTTPPAGAPWREWLDYAWKRIRLTSLVARPEPVVLQQGAALLVSVRDPSWLKDARLFAQVSGVGNHETNFWLRTAPGSLFTKRLAPGPQTVRAVSLGTNGTAWFSDVVDVHATAGATNTLLVDLRPGSRVKGLLDSSLPRPVVRGRVVAHVWPPVRAPQNHPPQWHAWTDVREDGSFELPLLPPGDLELVALCQGFVSTNGSGDKPGMRTPQVHALGTNDIEVTIGMEPTACLVVELRDDQDRPVADAVVSTWPNVRYGNWASTILTGDCYNSADQFLQSPAGRFRGWWKQVPDFQGKSDVSGLAVLPNLPTEVRELAVEHPRFALPLSKTPWGDKRRSAQFTLLPGMTNRVKLRLEPASQSTMGHY